MAWGNPEWVVGRGSEVQSTGFKSWTGAIKGGVHCCASCDRVVQGWMKLEADITMKKECKT
eukprot:11447599-Ditylum_brightwellii.AAC.1